MMKKINSYITASVLAILSLLIMIPACKDDEELDNGGDNGGNGGNVEIKESIAEYLQENYATMYTLFSENGVIDSIENYPYNVTVFVYPDSEIVIDEIPDVQAFVLGCVSDLAIGFPAVSDKLEFPLWSQGTSVASVTASDNKSVDNIKISKYTEASNGHIYELEKPFHKRPLYDYLKFLGEDYSIFKELVFRDEKEVDGKIVHSLMDRYNTTELAEGDFRWNMRDLGFTSTLLLPSNELIENAVADAYSQIRAAFGTVTSMDSMRVYRWIVESCFYDRELSLNDLLGYDDVLSISGYRARNHSAVERTRWRPSVQQVDVDNPIPLVNGTCYRVTELKVPNYIAIWRVKEYMVPAWNAVGGADSEYFNTDMRIGPRGYTGHGGYSADPEETEFNSFPGLSYDLMQGLYCDVDQYFEFKLINLDGEGTPYAAVLPAGEYYLGFGGKNDNEAAWYAEVSINGEVVTDEGGFWWKNLPTYDRNGGNNGYDGTGGYPWGFDVDFWTTKDASAYQYDTDGKFVSLITLDEPSELTVKIVRLTNTAGGGSIWDRVYLHSCVLRPTRDNY